MEQIGERLIWRYIPGTDIAIPAGGLNIVTVVSTLFVMVILWTLLGAAVRRPKLVPSRGQLLVELFIDGFDNLVSSSLELDTREANRKFLPLIASLFIFLMLANFVGFIPLPYLEEPTADINCTMALGIMAMTIATYCGISVKGLKGYIEEMLGPMWSQPEAKGGAAIAGKLSSLFFFPLNVIGEMAKVVSISFRIFGNILGGAIIITVVSQLTYFFLMPLGLNFFFVFFVGAIQAFVFTMLTLTYIAVAIK
jgi:F-type H+-transporting ATPase subunit a